MEYFYHYTKQENWEKIQREGLTPGKPIGRGTHGWMSTHELSSKPVTFGFISPALENWSKYNVERPSAEDPHSLLAYLLKCIGDGTDNVVLMKVHVKPDDDVRVGEYKNIWENFGSREDAAERVDKYCQSVVGLRDNFNTMALPEILCFTSIPPERIELVERFSARTYEEIASYIDRKKAEAKNAPSTSKLAVAP